MLDKISGKILNECMALKKNESCLIVTDSRLSFIGRALYNASLKITKKSKLILIPIPKNHGMEPPQNIAHGMLEYDVILMPTAKSLSHTSARKKASRRGARIASMPGITVEMMQRALDVDFDKIKALNEKFIKKINNKNKIEITTREGTDMQFNLKSRKWIGDDGIYTKKTAFGNLPAGEVFIAPLEGKTNGTLVIDSSISGLGKVEEKVIVQIKNGFIDKISGGDKAIKFQKLFKNRLYKNVAELGIGTNYKAKITGNVLEDEKVYGTFHVAFGNNRHFGGKVDVPFHLDVVIKKPVIYADDKLIIKSGQIIE